VTAEGSHPAAS